MKELKDLVEGDEVLVTGMSHRHIAKVDKVTKTQIIVNNARFKRDSGWQCGSDRWNVRRISVPTEKEISEKRVGEVILPLSLLNLNLLRAYPISHSRHYGNFGK